MTIFDVAALVLFSLIFLVEVTGLYNNLITYKRNFRVIEKENLELQKEIEHLKEEKKRILRNLIEMAGFQVCTNSFVYSEDGIAALPVNWKEQLKWEKKK